MMSRLPFAFSFNSTTPESKDRALGLAPQQQLQTREQSPLVASLVAPSGFNPRLLKAERPGQFRKFDPVNPVHAVIPVPACVFPGAQTRVATRIIRGGFAPAFGTRDAASKASMRRLLPRWPRRPSGDRLALVVIIAAAAVFVPLLVLGGVSWLYSLPEPNEGAPAIHLFAGTQPIGTIYPAHRAQSWVPLARMPRSVVDAVVIAEDRRFWTHAGVDALAVTRAAHVNFKRGEPHQGASTITQQLARTLFLDTNRTWSRKFRETAIALMLEVRYSKSRILEAYLNSVYLGQDGDVPVYGFPAAARRFLGKDVTALEIDEAAWLAGAIRAPNRMLAGSRLEAQRRRDDILLAMREQGFIDAEILRKATSKPVPSRPPDLGRTAPYFVDFVAAELARRAPPLASGEISVQTTLDVTLQRAAEAAVRNGVSQIEKARPQLAGRVQAAVIAIEPASGEIRALVGGRSYVES